MNDESNICPQCGGAIPENAPDGMCPKCLLAHAAAPTEAGTVHRTRRRPQPPALEEIAAAFPQLEIVELIGQGGMGFVFRARQPRLERDVALKILPQHLADDPKFAERFAREGKLLAKLNHPNIVSIFDFGQSGGLYYLLMEFVDGVNLRQAMRASRFTADQALSIVPKICEALQFAHEEGVLHRDIKPENILLDVKGRIKIADFGIAKLMEDEKATFVPPVEGTANKPSATEMSPLPDSADSNLTVEGISLGTPQYMAPEQLNAPASVDHRADIYSLGVVFYELLTGELPSDDMAPPSTKTPVNPRIDKVVLRALEKERERRPSSATDFRSEIESATRTQTRSPAPRSDRPTTVVPSDRVISWALGLAMFYSGIVAGIPLLGALPLGESALLSLFALLGIGVVVFLTRYLGFHDPMPTKDQTDRRRSWIRSFAMLGTLMCLPVCGFGLFFLSHLMEELLRSSSGWNPSSGEAIVVPFSILGLFALPWSCVQLVRASRASSRPDARPDMAPVNPWPRRVFWLIIALIVTPVLLVVVGLVAPLLAYRPLEVSAPSDETAAERSIVTEETYQGTGDINEFVELYTDASRRGDQAFLESMILREALNPADRNAAIALLAPGRPKKIRSATFASVEQRLGEKPSSFNHLPKEVKPRYIVHVHDQPEVGDGHSIEMTTYFPVVEKDGALYIGAFHSEELHAGEATERSLNEQSPSE